MDEDLPNYFDAMPGEKQKIWYATEVYYDNKFKHMTID